MKKALLLLFICICHLSLFSQSHSASDEQQFSAALQAAAQNFSRQPTSNSTPPPPAIKVPASMVSQAQQLHMPALPIATAEPVAYTPLVGSHQRNTNANCQDTSYTRLLGVYNAWMYLHSVTRTWDNGMLVTALIHDSTYRPYGSWKQFGLLVKLNENGGIVWLKKFEDLTPATINFVSMNRAYELANHDIICAARWNTGGQSSIYRTLLYRLTSTGNVIWSTCLKNNFGMSNLPPGTFTFDVESAKDGLNGDVIIGGTTNSTISWGSIESVLRLNSSGQIIWDANFGNHGADGSYLLGAEGTTAFVQNGQIVLSGMSHGRTYPAVPPAITLIKLDYNTGSLISKRFFKPGYTDASELFRKSFGSSWSKLTQLPNGNIVFYGKLFSDYLGTTTIKDHFGVVEFSPSFNLVGSYTISSALRTNYFNNFLQIDSSGKGLITTFEYISGYEGNVFFGAFNHYSRQFQKQRKVHYVDVGMPGNNGFTFFNDGGYAYLQSYFTNEAASKSYFEFRKMHNSDTSSVCLGKDTTLPDFLPLNIVEDSAYPCLDPNDLNKFTAIPFNVVISTLSTSSLDVCGQTNFCDTVKIHGNPVICGNNASSVFTAFKNNSCGAIVQWHINNNVIDSLKLLSDSSVKIWFRNANWQGKLYASLSGTACSGPITDSIAVSVVRTPEAVRLGADTILCNQQILVLHAGPNYAQYLWQNGSTDSVFTVATPGTYWVRVTDGCGNSSSDSIVISPFATAISIGADRSKCNGDTLHLSAPSGFLNYAWSNNYNISSLTAQNVIVNPLTDTAYYLKAEKITGCFAYDTVRITVYQSPLIRLGNDTSFCSGNSVVLNAGSNFQTYQWNTGATSRQISVKTAGTYSVSATTIQGCKSNDTVKVLAVFPLPVVNLDKAPGLCAGTSKTLDAGNFSSYLWNTGATNKTIVVNGIGTYSVHVTDANNCKGNDTTRITALYPLPANFLPADTSICSYGTLELKPVSNYNKYLWSTGLSSAFITVNKAGSYWLQATNDKNCIGKDSVLISVRDCLKGFYIPSAFSPNNDGKNEVFRPMLFGVVKTFSFSIYNRWGQVVFQTSNSQEGWDGKLAGNAVAAGVFVWNCTYQLSGEGIQTERGTVVLIR